MLDTKINVALSNYLSDCDLINKYNLKSVYHKPKLKKIVLDLNVLDFLFASDLIDKDQTDPTIQVKASVIFYILTGFMSYINFNKSLNSLKKLKISENNYSLKISINDAKELNSFLFLLFIENWSKLLLEDFVFFKNKNKELDSNIKLLKKKFIFSLIVPSNCFFELESFLSKTAGGVNSKNLNFKINFLFENPGMLQSSQILIKNLPYFWISG